MERRRSGRAALALALLLVAARTPLALAGERIRLETFVADPELAQLSLSPDGRSIAGIARSSEAQRLLVLDAEKLRIEQEINLEQRPIYGYTWASDERLLLASARSKGRVPRWMAIDRDGRKQVDIAYRGEGRDQYPIGGGLVSRLPHDSRHVLLSYLHRQTNRRMLVTEVYRANVRSGRAVLEVGRRHRVWLWLTDPAGAVRFGYGRQGSRGHFVHRDSAKAVWVRLDALEGAKLDALHFAPLGFQAGSPRVTVASRHEGDRFALYEFDPASGAFSEALVSHPRVDVGGPAVTDPHTGALVGVHYVDGHSRVVWLDPELRARAEMFDAATPGLQSLIVSWDRARERFLVLVESDRQNPMYLLYREGVKKLTPVASHRREFQASQLADSREVRYPARDGLEIPAVLTLPRDHAGPAPAVVMVHSGMEFEGFIAPGRVGPFRAARGFSPARQLLADRGFAVLAPNYRGSQGYGLAFERRGLGEWGRGIQDDIADAAQWLVAQGIADPGRICVYGSGFGGYAALLALARDPGLFRCGAAYQAITDLDVFFADRERFVYNDVLRERLGSDLPDPIDRAAAIQVPVFLAHGEDDVMIQLAHAERMAAALREAGTPVELLRLPDDPVGLTATPAGALYSEASRLEFFRRLVAFLERHVGPEPAS